MSNDDFSLPAMPAGPAQGARPEVRFPRTLHPNDPGITERMHADFRELWELYGRSLQTTQDALTGWRDAVRLISKLRDALYEGRQSDRDRAQNMRILLPYKGAATDD